MLNWINKIFHKEQTSKKEKIISSFILFFFIFAFGYGGSTMRSEEWTYYNSLIKPELTPPGWVFPIVWTLLFALIGLSAYYIWNHYEDHFYRSAFMWLYALNGFLVYVWPQTFFVKQEIVTALYVIIGLIVVVESMILVAFKANQKSAYLLMPYLLWLLFATYLNISIVALNNPAS